MGCRLRTPTFVQVSPVVLTVMPGGGLSVPAKIGVPPKLWVPDTATSTGPGLTVKSLASVV